MTKIHRVMDPGIIICGHCHRKVTKSGLFGMSPICPFCGKPINGALHP